MQDFKQQSSNLSLFLSQYNVDLTSFPSNTIYTNKFISPGTHKRKYNKLPPTPPGEVPTYHFPIELDHDEIPCFERYLYAKDNPYDDKQYDDQLIENIKVNPNQRVSICQIPQTPTNMPYEIWTDELCRLLKHRKISIGMMNMYGYMCSSYNPVTEKNMYVFDPKVAAGLLDFETPFEARIDNTFEKYDTAEDTMDDDVVRELDEGRHNVSRFIDQQYKDYKITDIFTSRRRLFLFPILYMDDHWLLIYVDMYAKTATIMNPNKVDHSRIARMARAIIWWVFDMHEWLYNVQMTDRHMWTIITADETYFNVDHGHSGIHVCMMMYMLSSFMTDEDWTNKTIYPSIFNCITTDIVDDATTQIAVELIHMHLFPELGHKNREVYAIKFVNQPTTTPPSTLPTQPAAAKKKKSKKATTAATTTTTTTTTPFTFASQPIPTIPKNYGFGWNDIPADLRENYTEVSDNVARLVAITKSGTSDVDDELKATRQMLYKMNKTIRARIAEENEKNTSNAADPVVAPDAPTTTTAAAAPAGVEPDVASQPPPPTAAVTKTKKKKLTKKDIETQIAEMTTNIQAAEHEHKQLKAQLDNPDEIPIKKLDKMKKQLSAQSENIKKLTRSRGKLYDKSDEMDSDADDTPLPDDEASEEETQETTVTRRYPKREAASKKPNADAISKPRKKGTGW